MFTNRLLAAATAAITVTNAYTIKSSCIVKGDFIGNVAGTGTTFSQQSQIIANLDSTSEPVDSRACATPAVVDGVFGLELHSFALHMSVLDGGDPFLMSTVGPASEDGFTCVDAGINGAGTGSIAGAVVFDDGSKITQINLYIGDSLETATPTIIGQKEDGDLPTLIQYFNNAETGHFLGFEYISNESSIEALRFLTSKVPVDGVDCNAPAVIDPNNPVDPVDPVDPTDPGTTDPVDPVTDEEGQVTRPEAEKDLLDEEEEDNSDTWYIILATCGGVIIILAAVACVIGCCKKTASRTSSKVEMIQDTDARQESEVQLAKDSTPISGVNASGNGSIPVIETDQEYGNPNVRTGRADEQKNNANVAKKDSMANDITM